MRGPRRRGRERDGERAPLPRWTLHVDGPTVAFGDPFREREPEARALRRAGTGGIRSIESLEEMRERIGRDAGPGIGHGEARQSFVARERDCDAAALRRELD